MSDALGNERTFEGARGKESGKHLVATFPDVTDRDVVEAMRGTDIYVLRSALPPPQAGEFYWIDLEGFRVVNLEGVDYADSSGIGELINCHALITSQDGAVRCVLAGGKVKNLLQVTKLVTVFEVMPDEASALDTILTSYIELW